MPRMRAARTFLWIGVFSWAIGLGGKLFDLLVLAGAWSASPPESLKLLPYGPHYPVDTGLFFLPTSAVILFSSLAAVAASWRRPAIRAWTVSASVLFVILFAFTVLVFWPMNSALYRTALGTSGLTPAEAIRMAHRWIVLDWLRVGVMATGLFCTVRAMSLAHLPVQPAN
jgi:hypothetical protein